MIVKNYKSNSTKNIKNNNSKVLNQNKQISLSSKIINQNNINFNNIQKNLKDG